MYPDFKDLIALLNKHEECATQIRRSCELHFVSHELQSQ